MNHSEFELEKEVFIKEISLAIVNKEASNQDLLLLLKEVSIKLHSNPSYYLILFTKGIEEFLEEYETYYDKLMMSQLGDNDQGNKISAKIYDALIVRLTLQQPSLSNAFANIYKKPKYFHLGLKLAWNTADIIWRYAGDDSTDYNYYTKRSLLVAVYLSAVKKYCNDHSEDFLETKSFVKLALDKIKNINKIKNIKEISIDRMAQIPVLRIILNKLRNK